MSVEVFTEEWVKQFGQKLNESEAYRQSAETWEWSLVLKLEADPSIQLSEDRAVYLDLWHGHCRDARMASLEDLEKASYIISADPYTWKQIFERELDAMTGIMRGRLKLEKGDMATLAGYAMAAKYLVDCALEVEAELPEALR
ncbi:MAG: SCP2 sterol-binding domain-containing protein [Candidatus Carbobacillus altaicus]|uniref:SCP2 domain-containing protein n=1 Tax=Candidatus Carbonibacillus altaicus TaxID=2163959 RepID=A0A2R6Y151_9BACL|nr:SCP2 sterol-binding domain-containing protein [Candidatus Carbobacillus altaicus]PTQ56362.1 MAG: hypothetical protein BSOLF_0297 [Candidatus Carbobacillus altaicus]